MIVHHPGCNPHYPEKVHHEPPQYISRQVLDDGYWVDTCVDCGAFETNLPPADNPYWDEARQGLPPPDVVCPQCGGRLVIDPRAQTTMPVWCPNPGAMPTIEARVRPAAVAFCMTCEWAMEIIRTPSR